MSDQPVGSDGPEAKFALGQIVATPKALISIPNEEILLALSRHVREIGEP